MKLKIVVLTDFSLAAERARAYAAALAGPLKADLHLVHVYAPQPVVTEFGAVLPLPDPGYVPATRRHLREVAEHLPVPATAELLEADWTSAVEDALHRYHPALLVAGLTATAGVLDEWLSNRTLPLAHEEGCPLLLVPEHLPDAALVAPRRLALAVEDRPFRLAPQTAAVTPLLDALAPDIVTVAVLPPAQRAAGWDGLRAAQHCGLAAAMPHSGLHKVISNQPATGILQAVDELEADLLALLDQGHGWLHKLIKGSVIDHVLRHTRVPVLLLSGQIVPLHE